MSERADRIDVIELAQAARRGWRALIVCTALGALGGLAVLTFAPRRFAGSASIVVKATPTSGATSVLAKLGLGLGDAAPALGAPAPLETEIAILSSRVLVGGVIDSLHLQADVTSPRSVAGRDVVSQLHLASAFRKVKYTVDQISGANTSSRQVTSTLPRRLASRSRCRREPSCSAPTRSCRHALRCCCSIARTRSPRPSAGCRSRRRRGAKS